MKNQSKINGIIRTIILSFGIIALSFNVGCKKKTDDVVTPVAQTCKVSKMILSNALTANALTADITYNSDFKPATLTATEIGQPTRITTCTYLPNGRIRLVESNAPNGYREYVLNSGGNIQTEYLSTNGMISTTQYEYNAEGYLSKKTTSNNITTYTYESGNLKQKVVNYTNTQQIDTLKYEYTGLLTATPHIYFDAENFLFPFGKNSKNLVTKIAYTYNLGSTTNITNYTYVINSENKVTKMTIQYGSSNPTIYDFSYTCR